MEFDDEDAVDKIVLLGLHVIKGVRLAAKKGFKKEEQIQDFQMYKFHTF